MKSVLVLCCSAVLVAACSSEPPADQVQTKTRAQKDSAIANSGLPGAKGVGQAMAQAESAKARQARIDSASKP